MFPELLISRTLTLNISATECPIQIIVFSSRISDKRNLNFSLRQYVHLKGTSGFFIRLFGICQVYCNFKLGYTCRITVIFETLKGGSLLINTLASNICFSYRNMFQNGVDTLSKIVDAFLSKSSKFYLVRIIRKCSNFASLCHKHLLRNYK